MIESNILGAAVGIQNQGVIDKTEGTSLPSTGDAVIAGKFKRGRMDKAFTVTRDNYKAILGHDPSNPSYQAVEDVFNRGVSEISVRRVGTPGKSQPSDGSGGDGDGDGTPEINFLLFNNETVPNDTTAGLVYSLNGGPLMEVIPTGQDKIVDVGEYVQRIALYDSEFIGFYESFMHLDKHALTGFGLSYLQSSPIFSSVLGDATDVLTTLTVYPANRLQSTNIDYDLFNHIVDPESHTPTDIDRFAQYGISPAVKNPDGSYTLKSQMHLDFNLLSPPGSP